MSLLRSFSALAVPHYKSPFRREFTSHENGLIRGLSVVMSHRSLMFRACEPDYKSDRGASLYRIMSPPFGESTRGNIITQTGAWLETTDPKPQTWKDTKQW